MIQQECALAEGNFTETDTNVRGRHHARREEWVNSKNSLLHICHGNKTCIQEYSFGFIGVRCCNAACVRRRITDKVTQKVTLYSEKEFHCDHVSNSYRRHRMNTEGIQCMVNMPPACTSCTSVCIGHAYYSLSSTETLSQYSFEVQKQTRSCSGCTGAPPGPLVQSGKYQDLGHSGMTSYTG